jgi:hypothetical protein
MLFRREAKVEVLLVFVVGRLLRQIVARVDGEESMEGGQGIVARRRVAMMAGRI